ncbi:hypothetical protein PFISCL1PPCAC_25063, partial [Pristionchus fissidentatus]
HQKHSIVSRERCAIRVDPIVPLATAMEPHPKPQVSKSDEDPFLLAALAAHLLPIQWQEEELQRGMMRPFARPLDFYQKIQQWLSFDHSL